MKKRMKLSNYDYPKVVYEFIRKKFQLLKTNLTEAFFLFKDDQILKKNCKRSESDHSHAK